MTTPEAARLYLAQHLVTWVGKGYAVYNPCNRPLEDLPFIIGFNNGGSPGWYTGQLISEDGFPLGNHICSHEGYMKHDLGILEGARPDRHEEFKKFYPNGYKMDFVGLEEAKNKTHLILEKAIEMYTIMETPPEELI